MNQLDPKGRQRREAEVSGLSLGFQPSQHLHRANSGRALVISSVDHGLIAHPGVDKPPTLSTMARR